MDRAEPIKKNLICAVAGELLLAALREAEEHYVGLVESV